MSAREPGEATAGSVARPGRPKGFDTATALVAAMEVFRKKGFEGTSVGDLLDATGLSRSSFYDEFGSKHDLLLSAIRHYCDINRDRLAGIAGEAVTAREAIHAMLVSIANVGGTNGCLLVNCITELAPHDEHVRAIAQEQGDRIENLLATLIIRHQGGGADSEADARARALISLAYGATLMRKTGMGEAEISKLLTTGEAILD